MGNSDLLECNMALPDNGLKGEIQLSGKIVGLKNMQVSNLSKI